MRFLNFVFCKKTWSFLHFLHVHHLHVCIFVCIVRLLACISLHLCFWVFSCFCCVFAGVLPALRRGYFLPAGASKDRAGALEGWAGAPGRFPRLWVCRGPRDAGARWEDQRECVPGTDGGDFPRGERYRLQFYERQLEPGRHTPAPLPAQRLLPPHLSPGTSSEPHWFIFSLHVRCWSHF